jgi:hypothetical protein
VRARLSFCEQIGLSITSTSRRTRTSRTEGYNDKGRSGLTRSGGIALLPGDRRQGEGKEEEKNFSPMIS